MVSINDGNLHRDCHIELANAHGCIRHLEAENGNLLDQNASLKAEVERLKAELTTARTALWIGHGHEGVYGDDGEMQCGQCLPHYDYKRDNLTDLVKKVCGRFAAVRQEVAKLRHDIDAYRGALGYSVPGDHDGRLSDGTVPVCGLCGAAALLRRGE